MSDELNDLFGGSMTVETFKEMLRKSSKKAKEQTPKGPEPANYLRGLKLEGKEGPEVWLNNYNSLLSVVGEYVHNQHEMTASYLGFLTDIASVANDIEVKQQPAIDLSVRIAKIETRLDTFVESYTREMKQLMDIIREAASEEE